MCAIITITASASSRERPYTQIHFARWQWFVRSQDMPRDVVGTPRGPDEKHLLNIDGILSDFHIILPYAIRILRRKLACIHVQS